MNRISPMLAAAVGAVIGACADPPVDVPLADDVPPFSAAIVGTYDSERNWYDVGSGVLIVDMGVDGGAILSADLALDGVLDESVTITSSGTLDGVDALSAPPFRTLIADVDPEARAGRLLSVRMFAYELPLWGDLCGSQDGWLDVAYTLTGDTSGAVAVAGASAPLQLGALAVTQCGSR